MASAQFVSNVGSRIQTVGAQEAQTGLKPVGLTVWPRVALCRLSLWPV